ncbi:MAG: S-layer homology domain-containing protein [Oscillibacter sp.]|nr:S-layer homology domain-containing protein [Oscillibacter sp.]
MKKIALALLLCAAVTVFALAAGGDAGDPLISLSYLTGLFTEQTEARIDRALDESDAQLKEAFASGRTVVTVADTWQETRLKRGDSLLGATGTNVLLLAGEAQVTFSSGSVIDVTSGTAVQSGAALLPDHRYMAAEDTAASFTVTGKTAVLTYQGQYAFTYSNAIDYNAMASALKTLHLFRGSFTGYGQGFDLELAPTRLQALIMFVRVLGEEEQALAWSGSTPFTDIEKGSQAEKYVGYAYEKGYTNGYTATTFRPGATVNAYQYTEFILRAMGYSSVENTDLSDTFERAQRAGVMTAGEAEMLRTDRFLRAELVYLSYYALDSALPDSMRTLSDELMAKGVFTSEERSAAWSLVSGSRL